MLAERFAATTLRDEDFLPALQRTYIELWLSNCLTSAKTWLVCSNCIALFCRSMLACGVDEVDRQIQDEVNMMLMAVAPPALSLDAEEAKRVDQGCEMLSSAERAGSSLCGYFHKFPGMLQKARDSMLTLQSGMKNGQQWLAKVSESQTNLRTMMTSGNDFASCVSTMECATCEYYLRGTFHNLSLIHI